MSVQEVFFPSTSSEISDMLLKRDEILDLYESRNFMLVPFECIEQFSYVCSNGPSSEIPQDVAHRLYSPNDSVTALQAQTAIVLLDGNRCYNVWKASVAEGILPQSVVLNVIMDYQGLNDFQKLQLSIYCNLRSASTRLRTFQEKLTTCRNALSAYINSHSGKSLYFSSVDGGSISSSLCEIISRGLHMTTMFDGYIHPLRRDLPYFVWIRFIPACIRTSIELRNYPELSAAKEHLTVRSEFFATCYLHRQFFYDFVEGKYSSCSRLPNMILFFVLAETPLIVNSGKTKEQVDRKEFRLRLRAAAVGISGLIANFLSSLKTKLASGRCSLCPQLQQGFLFHEDGSLCCAFVFMISKDIINASKDVEKLFLNARNHSILESMSTVIMKKTIDLILYRAEK